LSALRDAKLGWQTFGSPRFAAKRSSTRHIRFRPTDSNWSVVASLLTSGMGQLLDLVRDQFVFEKLVFETMRKGLHYADQDQPQWWKPLGNDRTVVVHPARAFGAPVALPSGIRTRVALWLVSRGSNPTK